MLKNIINILKKPKAQRNILILLVIILLLILHRCGSNETVNKVIYDQNIAALTDSIREYEGNNGQLVQEKKALISSNKDLKKLNTELADEVNNLKDDPIIITKYNTVVKRDTVVVPVYPDGDIVWSTDSTKAYLKFTWDDDTTYTKDNWRSLGGDFTVEIDAIDKEKSSIQDFIIKKDEIGLSFTTGLTENKDGMLEIFITSPHPGFKATDINGALIDPRESKTIKKFFPPKRWGLGFYGGYGTYLDPINTSIGTGVQFGFGIQYNIIQWNFK